MKKMQIFSLLLLRTVLMMLSNGKYLMALAAWVFPFVLMVAVKDTRERWAWLLLTLVMALGNQLSFHNMLPQLGIPLFGFIPALAGGLYALPFVLQKLCYRRFQPFLVTLIFPSSYALLDYMNVYLYWYFIRYIGSLGDISAFERAVCLDPISCHLFCNSFIFIC